MSGVNSCLSGRVAGVLWKHCVGYCSNNTGVCVLLATLCACRRQHTYFSQVSKCPHCGLLIVHTVRAHSTARVHTVPTGCVCLELVYSVSVVVNAQNSMAAVIHSGLVDWKSEYCCLISSASKDL